ncbi:lytic murein transglycosylase [Bradyrhizobium sp. LHD-71]|nr:lytic murein transglycosylase [Bradyrhizobium sp. LHD-71]MDQ8726760.1 lytic murein transglycosylase [Bradyrhizobium sp. LHD-71]
MPAAALAAVGFIAFASDVAAQAAPTRGPLVLTRQGIAPPLPITGSIPQPAAKPAAIQSGQPQTAPVKEWSGEDGASGHPLMTAAAIRQAAANFPYCVANLWPDAAKRNISRDSFERYTAGLTPDLRIMDFVDAQPEFTKAVWDYLDILVTDARLARGREMLATHRATFDAVEKAYGVDRYIVAAIWGIESNYSTQGGDRSVLRSTATLACIGRRQAYFKDEFLSALEILHRGDLSPGQLKGSWAGAFGATQFMPTAFKRSAIDFDGDGRRDVVDSVADIVASTANKFKKDGWRAGETWGYEVEVPRGFNYALADRSKSMTIAQWERLGIRRAGDKAFPRAGDKAFLLAPGGAEGPGFLMLPNFRAIMRYNPAEAYALAIGHFADRLRGGAPLVQNWPREERVLTRAERLELQQLLSQRGFYRGEPDGNLGTGTRDAVRSFQASIGAPADGFASSGVLDRLRRR